MHGMYFRLRGMGIMGVMGLMILLAGCASSSVRMPISKVRVQVTTNSAPVYLDLGMGR